MIINLGPIGNEFSNFWLGGLGYKMSLAYSLNHGVRFRPLFDDVADNQKVSRCNASVFFG